MTSVSLWILVAHGGILLGDLDGSTPSPRRDEAVMVTVTDDAEHPLPGQTVRVVHRPGLALEQEQAIGITDARGQVEWTPAASGLATVRAGSHTHAVQVRGPFPTTTLIAGLLVLVLGLGSIGWGLRAGARPGGRS